MDYYTIGKCSKCGKNVKLDFLERLLNLDKKILYKKCKIKEATK